MKTWEEKTQHLRDMDYESLITFTHNMGINQSYDRSFRKRLLETSQKLHKLRKEQKERKPL